MRHRKLLLLLLFLPLLAAPTHAQFVSMEGDWWLKVTGDKGSLLLTFKEEVGSSFEVTGGGFSTKFGTFYTISNDEPQTLSFDFAGRIAGILQIEDFSGLTSIGTLEILSGNVDDLFERVKLKGSLALLGGEPRKVTIRGGRLSTNAPNWTGRTHKGRISGTGVKSRKYDITFDNLPVVGFPSLLLTGLGSVQIDGEPMEDVEIGGVLLATPEGLLFGEFTFDDDSGIARGRVREVLGEPSVLRIRGITSGGRKVKIRARLDIPIVVPQPPAKTD